MRIVDKIKTTLNLITRKGAKLERFKVDRRINTIHDPFISKAITNWLHTVNEGSYQPVFCEWLKLNGHIIKSSIKNTNFEQGKDVISIDENNVIHAFQLKGGKITLDRWRREVRPEIDILIDGGIQYPGIPRDSNFVPYLVTNSDIAENVRSEIQSLNDKKWKDNPLHIVEKGDLNAYFQSMSQGFLPDSLAEYKQLVELMVANGEDFVDVGPIFNFLNDNFVKREKVVYMQIRRDIASVVLYVNLMMGTYLEKNNYISCIRILAVGISTILYMADHYSLKDSHWVGSYKLLWEEMMDLSKQLETYISDSSVAERFPGPFDRFLMEPRRHAASSVIFSLKIAEFLMGDSNWKKMDDEHYLKDYKNSFYQWSEASYVPIILGIALMDAIKAPNSEKSNRVAIEMICKQLIDALGRKVDKPSIDPIYVDLYAHMNEVASLNKKIQDEKEDNRLNSYILESIILMLVRLGSRTFLEKEWVEISHFRLSEFIYENENDVYKYRNDSGEIRTRPLSKVQSWKKLEESLGAYDTNKIPNSLKRFPEFIPYLLVVYPHRINATYLKFLLSKLDSKAKIQ